MKATELLRNQHQQLEALFEPIEGAEGKESRALVKELATALVAHLLIEGEIFYPVAEESLAATTEVRRSYEEHALVEFMLQKLLKTDPGDPGFHARASVLRELFQRHVREEEDDLLPRADREIDEGRLEELGKQMEARFKKIQGQHADNLGFDGIEVANGSIAGRVAEPRVRALNRKTYQLAETGGSDAHFLPVIGSAYTSYPGRTAAELRRAIEDRTTRGKRDSSRTSRPCASDQSSRSSIATR